MSLRGVGLYFLKLSSRRPQLMIFLSLVIFATMLALASHLTQAGALEDQLDPEMQTTKDLLSLRSEFSSSNGMIGVLIPKDNLPWNSAKLCEVQTWINTLIDKTPQLSSIFTPFHLRKTDQGINSLSYPTLLSNPCEPGTPDQDLSAILQTPWQKFITDPQAQEFTIALGIRSLETPGRYGTFEPAVIQNILDQSNALKENFIVHWVGVAAQQFYTIEGMAHSQILNVIVILLFLVVLRLLFGTWRAGAMFLCTLFFASTVVYGGMAYFHHPVDALSISLFLILSVASLEDFIFISYDRMNAPNAPFRQHFRRLLIPGFWTSFSTSLGFGSLMISGLVAIRHFGMWAALGSMVEFGAVFIIWPAFLQRFPTLQNWVRPEKSYFYSWGQNLSHKAPPRWLLRLCLMAFPIGFVTVFHLRLAQTPTDTFPADHPVSITIEHLKKTRGWIADASLIFSPALSAERRVEILARIKTDPLVASIESRESILQYLYQDAPPLRQDLIAREFSYSPLAKRYENEWGESRAILSLNDSQTEKLNKLRADVDNLCPQRECHLAGDFVAFADFSTALIKTLFESFFLSLVLVGILLAYLAWDRQKSLRLLPALLISSFWGPAMMMCLIYLMDVSVNMITCIVASTLVGLTGDNAIQYLFAGKNGIEEGIKKRGVGSIQCGIVMSLTALVFLGSYFEPPRTLGILLALGFVTALIGDLWILKGLLKKDY